MHAQYILICIPQPTHPPEPSSVTSLVSRVASHLGEQGLSLHSNIAGNQTALVPVDDDGTLDSQTGSELVEEVGGGGTEESSAQYLADMLLSLFAGERQGRGVEGGREGGGHGGGGFNPSLGSRRHVSAVADANGNAFASGDARRSWRGGRGEGEGRAGTRVLGSQRSARRSSVSYEAADARYARSRDGCGVTACYQQTPEPRLFGGGGAGVRERGVGGLWSARPGEDDSTEEEEEEEEEEEREC